MTYQTANYALTGIEQLTPSISRFYLEPSDMPIWLEAGQYVEICLPTGEKAPFSVAGFKNQQLEFHIKHLPNHPIANAFLKALNTYDHFKLMGPFGHCILPKEISSPLVFIAGGTGIAPHKAMIDKAIDMQLDLKIQVYWGIRCLEDLYLPEWFASLKQFPSIETNLVLSEPDSTWVGKTGYIHRAFIEASEAAARPAMIYASGPYPMIKALEQSLHHCGFDSEKIFSDMIVRASSETD